MSTFHSVWCKVKRNAFLLSLCSFLPAFFGSLTLQAQTTLATPVPSGLVYYSDTQPGVIVFGVRNNNSSPVVITGLGSYVENGHTGTYTLWYHTSAITGAPAAISTANGWIQAAPSGTVNATANGVIPILSGLNITIPANTTYRFALESPIHGPFYGTSGSTGDAFSGGGLTIFAQANVASPTYAGAFPGPPTLTPRSFYGSLTFSPVNACTAPPTPGTATASVVNACLGQNFTLDLTGNSIGTGQTYQWQSSPDNTNWTNIGPSSSSPIYTTSLTANTWYRAVVTCSGNAQNSVAVQVLYQGAPVSGTFTINAGAPASSTNFQTFAAAVNSLSCGINGPVVFNVVSGSGPYNEQVSIPAVSGSSATNTITINGNGNTLSFTSSNTNLRAGITLNGSRYVTINNLVIDGTAGTYGWGIHLTNAADRNTISNNTINISKTNTTAGNHAGVVISGSTSSATSAGNNGNFNTITGNTITGGYYGVIAYGSTTAGAQNQNNQVINNVIQDVYAYSVYAYYQINMLVRGNNIFRPTRTSALSGGAGVYVTTGNTATLVEKNRIHNMFDAMATSTSTIYGVYVAADGIAGQENKIVNNAIYNLGGNGTQYGIYNTTGPFMQAYHNTVVLNDQAATTGVTNGLYQTGTAAGIEFKNNIVYVTRSGTGAKRAIFFNTTTSTIVSDNNVLYLNSASGTNNHLGQFGTTNYTTLNDWKTANSNAYDQQSSGVDPQFADAANGNFYPNNPAVATLGLPLGITTDITNAARSATTPTPGAWEVVSTACVTPPTPGTASASPSGPVCPSTNVLLDVTGNSTGTGQTYQWQTSATSGGTYVNVGSSQTTTAITINPTATAWYRLAVTCSGNTTFSTPVQVLVNPLLPGGIYTINSALPTSGSNYQSFGDAVSAISCGIAGPVVFNVAAGSGPYTEQITIPQIQGASAVNTITFNGNNATIQATPVTGLRHIIQLDGADYVILKKLNIVAQPGSAFGWGVHLTNGADWNKVDSSMINMFAVTSPTQSNSAGIVASGSSTSVTTATSASHNTFSNNTVVGAYQGVILNGTATSLNGVRNVITENEIRDFLVNGIEVVNQDSVQITFNNIHRTNRSDLGTTISAGIELGANNINAVVNSNRIHDSHTAATGTTGTFYGIYSNADDAPVGSENRVINNLVYNINSLTGTQYGLYNSSSNGVLYYHNTVVLDNAASTAGTTRGFYQTTAATGIELKDNIIYINRGGTGAKYALYFGTTTSTIVSNNNILFNGSTTGTNGIGFYSTAQVTLADWQTVNTNAYDQNSLSVDPQFASPAAGNFYPTNAAVNTVGVNVGVAKDILGINRSATTPTPGAYERVSTTGVDIGAIRLVSPTLSGCYTGPQTITVRIKNYGTIVHNFVAAPVTVSAAVTGPNPASFSTVISTGTLAVGDSLDVVLTTTYAMSAPGTYTFNASASSPADPNISNNDMAAEQRTVATLTAGTAASSPASYCVTGGTPTITLTNSAGGVVQWQTASSATGPWTNVGNNSTTYTPATAITGTTYYRAYLFCGSASDTSNVVTVPLNVPQLLSTTPATRCGPGTVNLSATAAPGNTVSWYAAATGGSPLGTGTTFTTPVLGATTDFYVAASSGISTQTVGVTNITSLPNIATNSSFTAGMVFDVPAGSVTIQSVDIYPTTAVGTNFQIVVRSGGGTGTVIATYQGTTTVSGTTGAPVAQTVPVNFTIPAGINYAMTFFNGTLQPPLSGTAVYPGALRNNPATGATFPYSIPGTISITGGTATNTWYYFYNWQIGSGCETPRTAVTATVNTAPAFTVTPNLTVCNNASTQLSVTSPLANFNSYVWSPGAGLFTDAAGTIAYTGGSASSVYVRQNVPGTYTYYVSANNTTTLCSELDSVKVTVLPASLTLTASPSNICVSGSSFLTLSPLTGITSVRWSSSPNGTTYTVITGITGTTFATPVLTTTTYYKAEILNSAGAVCLQSVDTITVTNPQVLTTTPATLCGSGTLTLQATGSAGSTLNWYAAATGGASLGTGTSFTTPVLTVPTTYYVGAAQGGGGTVSLGRPNRTNTTANTSVNTGLVFNAPSGGVLQSVAVYPSGTGAGTLKIVLKTGNTATATRLDSVTVNITGVAIATAPKTVVPLNFNVPPGTNYYLSAEQFTGGLTGLGRELTGGGPFPYTDPGTDWQITGSWITTGAPTTTTYYYFYDWQVGSGCESPRVAVTATVHPNTAITTQPTNQAVCSGSGVSLSVVAVGGNLTYQWRKGGVNIAGATGATYAIANATAADAGLYDVVISGACGNATSSQVTLTVATTNSWVGTTSTDWNNPNNWCGGLPTASTDVIIPASTPFSPNINGAADVRSLTINTGAVVTVTQNGILSMYGNFVNNGTFNASTGVVVFKGSTNQNVGTLTAGTIILNGSGGITLTGTMTPVLALTLTNGNITLGASNILLNGTVPGSVASHIITNGTGSAVSNNINNSAVVVPVGPDAASYNPVTINNGQGRNYSVRVATGINPAITNNARGINRTWNITPNSAVTSNVDITFQYADADANGSASGNATMEAGVHNGTQWILASPAGGITPSGTATARNVTIQTQLSGPMVLSNAGGFTYPSAVPAMDTDITQVQLLPNVVQDKTILRLTARSAMKADWTIRDAGGRVVLRFSRNVVNGRNDIELQLGRLAGGTYFLEGYTNKGRIQTLRFVRL